MAPLFPEFGRNVPFVLRALGEKSDVYDDVVWLDDFLHIRKPALEEVQVGKRRYNYDLFHGQNE